MSKQIPIDKQINKCKRMSRAWKWHIQHQNNNIVWHLRCNTRGENICCYCVGVLKWHFLLLCYYYIMLFCITSIIMEVKPPNDEKQMSQNADVYLIQILRHYLWIVTCLFVLSRGRNEHKAFQGVQCAISEMQNVRVFRWMNVSVCLNDGMSSSLWFRVSEQLALWSQTRQQHLHINKPNQEQQTYDSNNKIKTNLTKHRKAGGQLHERGAEILTATTTLSCASRIQTS